MSTPIIHRIMDAMTTLRAQNKSPVALEITKEDLNEITKDAFAFTDPRPGCMLYGMTVKIIPRFVITSRHETVERNEF